MAGVYEIRDGRLYATELSRGPWDPGAQHGGAPAAILMREFESFGEADDGLAIARVTYELLRPVPLGALSVTASVLRPGRRVQLLDGSLVDPEGVEVVRARALRVARAPVSAGFGGSGSGSAGVGRIAGQVGVPEDAVPGDFPSKLPLFPGSGVEIRFVRGSFAVPGPATAWFRLRVPLVAGEETSALQRLAAVADFPNGISSELPWTEWLFINPDLTLFVEREPVGDWICLDASMRVADGGVGLAEAVLYDLSGRVGRSVQTLYVARRP